MRNKTVADYFQGVLMAQVGVTNVAALIATFENNSRVFMADFNHFKMMTDSTIITIAFETFKTLKKLTWWRQWCARVDVNGIAAKNNSYLCFSLLQ